MGGDTTTTTNASGRNTQTQNVSNINDYTEEHNHTYNNNVHDTNSQVGDITNGNVRNMNGLTNNGSQCFGSGCLMNLRQQQPLINLQGLQPIEMEILMNLQNERATNPAAYVQHLSMLL